MAVAQAPAKTATAPPTIRLYRPGELNPSKGICIYGKGGVGKTSLLHTMPGNGLVIDFPSREGGTEVLAEFYPRIQVTAIEHWDEIEPLCWQLAQSAFLKEHGFKWIAVDSITAAQKYAGYKIAGQHPLTEASKMTGKEMGAAGDLVAEFIFRVRQLPLYSVWIGLQRKRDGDDDGNGGIWGPDVYPSVQTALVPSMKIVGRMRSAFDMMGQPERQLIIGPCPDMQTKVRAPLSIKIPFAIRNPNLEMLLRYLASQNVKLDSIEEPSMVALDAVDDDLALVPA